MASFFLTTKCNLRCVYCYNCEERMSTNEQYLPFNIAKAGIDYFFDTNTSRHIRFYGPGEPTQAFSLLKDIVEYAKTKGGDKVTVELQSNGAFNEKICDYIYNNVNIVWISMDGTPEIQNYNRPFVSGIGSSTVVERNVKRLAKRSVDAVNGVGIRVTITNENINRQIKMIDYFSSLGIKFIWNDPVFPEVEDYPFCDDEKRKNSFNFNYDLYVDKYLEAYEYAKKNGVFYGSFLTINFDGESHYHCRACTPVPHFTTDGFISACDLVTFGAAPKHMDCFVYGKWNDNEKKFIFNNEKIQKLRERSTDNMENCCKCEVASHCGGYCLGEVANETGSYMKNKSSVCHAIRRLFKELGPAEFSYPFLHP